MDASTIASIASAAVSLLVPYLKGLGEELAKKAGGKIGETAGETALSKVKQLHSSIKAKFAAKPAAAEALDDLTKSPDDSDLQATVRTQLKKILSSDEDFAKELADLLKEAVDACAETVFHTSIQGDVQNLVQIGHSAFSVGNDFVAHDKVGRDKFEIHAQHFNWTEAKVVEDDEAWLRQGLDWLRIGFYHQYGSNRVYRYGVADFPQWEQQAKALDNISLYTEARTLVEKRAYPQAVAYWAELWKRAPKNSEYESYLRLCLSKVEREIRIANAIDALMGMAQSAWHLGAYRDVIDYMRQVLALSPNHSEALRLLVQAEKALENVKAEQRKRLSERSEEPS